MSPERLRKGYKIYLHTRFPGLGCTERVGVNQYKKLTKRDKRGGRRKRVGNKTMVE